ncbi:MAG: hypothetical protein QXW84_03565 [Archaeoglobaceae archaeon]
MPPISEFAQLMVALINLNLEFLTNLLNLTAEASRNATLVSSGQNLNFSNVWGIIYGILVTSTYGAAFLNSTLEVAANNTSALTNIGNTINYLGSNATVIVGDFSGKSGLSYILNTKYRLQTNETERWAFGWNFANLTKAMARFLSELGEAVNRTFY